MERLGFYVIKIYHHASDASLAEEMETIELAARSVPGIHLDLLRDRYVAQGYSDEMKAPALRRILSDPVTGQLVVIEAVWREHLDEHERGVTIVAGSA